jgi:hypothetical protein
MKIYKLYASYEDYDSSSLITIGVFSDYEKAQAVKKKWSLFHERNSIPEMPDYWDPKKDKWYSESVDFCWEESEEYHTKMQKNHIFNNFVEIKIDEYNLDEDRFSKCLSWNDQTKSLIESFDRDYKIDSIIGLENP